MTDVTEPTLDVTGDIAPADTTPVIPPPAPAAGAERQRRRGPATSGLLLRTAGGIGAVGVKELRGRMRGRRAFAILTGYLILLAAFAWMVELMMERTYSTSFGGSAAFATAAIGQGIFAAVLMLETLVVVFLATMATAGSISLEREKQTLEMLAATPITSFAIVLGKLLSALIYVWLLIAASIPLTAIVFVFGGVAPDDLVRGYVVLIVTALGFGAFGLFCSSLVKRTQAATAIALFGVLAISMGTLFVIVFWNSLATPVSVRDSGTLKGSPPDVLQLHQPVHRPGRHRAGRGPVRDRLHAQRRTASSARRSCCRTRVRSSASMTTRAVASTRAGHPAGEGIAGRPSMSAAMRSSAIGGRRCRSDSLPPPERGRRLRIDERVHLGEDRRRVVPPLGRLPAPVRPVRLTHPALAPAPGSVPRPEPGGRSMRIPSRPTRRADRGARRHRSWCRPIPASSSTARWIPP